jgi:hypothetical protein
MKGKRCNFLPFPSTAHSPDGVILASLCKKTEKDSCHTTRLKSTWALFAPGSLSTYENLVPLFMQ